MPSRTVEIKVIDGGALSASLSLENVGEANYVEKSNWRRDKDQEIRREGWISFRPDLAGPDTQDDFDATDTVIRLAELVRPNGERVLVGASRTDIKRFNYDTGIWDSLVPVGPGYPVFSPNGKRWQTVTMNGYLVLNNGVDLPVTYRAEDTQVIPIYELRERGVVSAGRMEQSNGFILFADITEIQANQLGTWMRGYLFFNTNRTPTPMATDPYAIVSPGDIFKDFVVDQVANPGLVLELPANPVPDFYFWTSYSDFNPANAPTTISPAITDPAPDLSQATSRVLIRWDAVAQRWTATNFPDGVVPDNDPYGEVTGNITNRYPWRVMNGEFANPRNWAPIVDAYMDASSNNLTVSFVPRSFTEEGVRVGVINGGPDGGVLGGQSGYPNGILVFGTTLNTGQVQLETSTDASISYPRVVSVTKFSDLSTLSAAYDLQDDGSLIHGLKVLQNLIIVYRKTGIYVGRYTGISVDAQGNTTGPFNFTPHYTGFNVPLWGDCIANVNGQYHLYPAEGSRWYRFDGNTNPQIHPQTDLARNLFFKDIDPILYEPWAIENPLTKEWWFHRDGLVFAYDFEYETISIIDTKIDAAVFALKPGSDDVRWFVLGIGPLISVYGFIEEYDPPRVFRSFFRRGVEYSSVIKSGLINFQDSYNEKTLLSYVPVMATGSQNAPWEVTLFGAWNPSVTPVALLAVPEVLPTPAGENLVACFFQALYFQFSIKVPGSGQNARYSSSIMEYEKVNAGRVNTRINQ